MITSVWDYKWGAFGDLVWSGLSGRFARIAQRQNLDALLNHFEDVGADLYGENATFDVNECATLQDEYELFFKGDPALVEAVFQAVGFQTQLGVSTSDDGSEAGHVIKIAPPTMVLE
jgi:hypothetical protein